MYECMYTYVCVHSKLIDAVGHGLPRLGAKFKVLFQDKGTRHFRNASPSSKHTYTTKGSYACKLRSAVTHKREGSLEQNREMTGAARQHIEAQQFDRGRAALRKS
jgi:hypothetical protein